MSSCTETGCGFKSECILSECVCENGYFVNQDFILDGNSTNCDGNIAFLAILYICQLLSALYSLLSYLKWITRKSQAKRLIPYFFGMGSYIFLSILKLSNVEGRFYGEDIAITILFALVFPSTMLASHVILIKYVKLMYRMLCLKPQTAEIKLRRHESILNLSSVFSFVAAAVFISTLAVDDSDEIQILFRCAFGLMILTSLSFSYSHFKFGNEVKELLSIPAKQDAKLRTLKLRVDRVNQGSSGGQFIFMLLYIAAASSSRGLEIYGYLAPLHGTICCLITVVVVRGNRISESTFKGLSRAEIGYAPNNSTADGFHRQSSERLATTSQNLE